VTTTFVAVALGATLASQGAELGGTQPNELILGVEPSSSCNCHDNFNNPDVYRPAHSYRATMMALSARDPLFRAAFIAAREDRPELSELCLRCHAPAGWLNDRSKGDLDALIADDLEGVTCDICHRMEAADPPLVGDGQYTISSRSAKRSRRGNAPGGGHQVIRTSYVASADSCAICHSLFNPTEDGHDEDGNVLPVVYYEQRTYEEWLDSDFSKAGGETCIDCHMTTTRGEAAEGAPVYDDLKVHDFVGGNRFALDAVAILDRNVFSPSGVELRAAREWADRSLARAASLEITEPSSQRLSLQSGDTASLGVRLTNLTGHKLPSGYPEGRRVYMEVSITMDGQDKQIVSGRWDQATGDLVRDEQLRSYDTEHGRVMNGVSRREHSLILMNQIISDTRLPPRGFMPDPSRPDMIPAGRDYGSGPYRHYDDHTYELVAPDVPMATTGTVTVRAMYQATDGETVRYLLQRANGTEEGNKLEQVWEALGHAPPREMVSVSIPITVRPGAVDVPDAGTSDAGTITPTTTGGCGCNASQARGGLGAIFLLGLLAFVRRR
jgi:hypothetical protein